MPAGILGFVEVYGFGLALLLFAGKVGRDRIQFPKVPFAAFLMCGLLLVGWQNTRPRGFDFDGIHPELFLRACLTVTVAFVLADILVCSYGRQALRYFLKMIVIACVVQGTVLWLTFLVPGFRLAMSEVFYRDPDPTRQHLVELRSPGFVSTGGDGLALNQGLLSIVALSFAMYASDLKSRKVVTTLILISGLSTFTTGRSGLFLFLALAILLVIYRYVNGFTLLIGLVVATIGTSLLIRYAPDFPQTVVRVFGSASLEAEHPLNRLARSFNANEIEYYFMALTATPDRVSTLLFGGGLPLTDSYLNLDQFYYRVMSSIGVVALTLLVVGAFVLPLISTYKSQPDINWKHRDSGRLIGTRRPSLYATVALAFGLLASFKTLFLTSRVFLTVFLVLTLLTVEASRSCSFRYFPQLRHRRRAAPIFDSIGLTRLDPVLQTGSSGSERRVKSRTISAYCPRSNLRPS